MIIVKAVILIAVIAFWFFLPLLPSMVVTYYKARNLSLLTTSSYWMTVMGAVTPWIIWFLLLTIYDHLTASRSDRPLGLMLGLISIYPFVLVVMVLTTLKTLELNRITFSGFWSACKWSALPFGVVGLIWLIWVSIWYIWLKGR